MAQVKTRMTVVRMAVARLESTPATPTLARMAVAAAKMAERSAQRSHVMGQGYPVREARGGLRGRRGPPGAWWGGRLSAEVEASGMVAYAPERMAYRGKQEAFVSSYSSIRRS